jgi:diadenosine tetraphosphate (Ap4A) HIT family hydrolase
VSRTVVEENLCANAHFRIEPCIRCPIAGYLIVSPQPPASSLSELSPNVLASLGPTLATATRVIEEIVRPERVYCLLFAEETRSVDFHLFPRADWLFSRYARAHPDDPGISGPRLLDWARRTFRSPLALTTIRPLKPFFGKSPATSNHALQRTARSRRAWVVRPSNKNSATPMIGVNSSQDTRIKGNLYEGR